MTDIAMRSCFDDDDDFQQLVLMGASRELSRRENKKLNVQLMSLQIQLRLVEMLKDKPQDYALQFIQALKQTQFNQPPTMDDEDVPEEPQSTPSRARPCGPKVQLYDAHDTSRLVKVYDGITEATRGVEHASFTRIKFVATHRLEYLGYRWYLIDRNDPNPETPRDIGPTQESRQRNCGLVAMLTLDQTAVVKVFATQKEAAAHVSQTVSAISPAVKYGKPLSGHHWRKWDMVDPALQRRYLESHRLPEVQPVKRGTHVQQLDPDTLQVVKTYQSMQAVIKAFAMSPKTLKSAEAEGSTCHGFKWRFVEADA
jgi:hypothetical protein